MKDMSRTGWIVILVIFALLFASVSSTIWAIVMGVVIGAFCVLMFTHKPSRMRVVQLFKKR